MAEPGTIRAAMPVKPFANAAEPSLLNLMHGIVAVVVFPEATIEKFVDEFPDEKLLGGIMAPGAMEIALPAALIGL